MVEDKGGKSIFLSRETADDGQRVAKKLQQLLFTFTDGFLHVGPMTMKLPQTGYCGD